jgi:hypothetical protein
MAPSPTPGSVRCRSAQRPVGHRPRPRTPVAKHRRGQVAGRIRRRRETSHTGPESRDRRQASSGSVRPRPRSRQPHENNADYFRGSVPAVACRGRRYARSAPHQGALGFCGSVELSACPRMRSSLSSRHRGRGWPSGHGRRRLLHSRRLHRALHRTGLTGFANAVSDGRRLSADSRVALR